MSTVEEALARISGKRPPKEATRQKRTSPCCKQPLVRRTLWSKCWICSQCGMACGSSKYVQLQIDMK